MRIKIVNLNKVYPGGKKALKDLNLEIEPGMFGLLGPNRSRQDLPHEDYDSIAELHVGNYLFRRLRYRQGPESDSLPVGLPATGFPFFREAENVGIPRLWCRACRGQGQTTPGRSGRRDATQSWFV